MYIAMNNFKVIPGCEDEFIEIWANRERRLDEMEGFMGFAMLRGATNDDCTPFISHTTWASRANFDAWVASQQFKDAHKGAKPRKNIYIGSPRFEGFDAVLVETPEA